MFHHTTVPAEEGFRIPARAAQFDAFRKWLHSDACPAEARRISYIGGHIEVDLSMEEFFEHGQVKAEIGAVLHQLVKEMKFGRFAPDGTRYTNARAKLSTEPDGMVLSNESMASGRVRFASGSGGRNTEVLGTPDIVIEIISPSSATKDSDRLMAAYHKAGIPEYWLVDVRDGELRFDILARKPGGYVAGRKSDGWVKSRVLGKSFRLAAEADDAGEPEYTLSVK